MAGSKRRKVETKVYFHVDAEDTPYLVKSTISLGKLTLRDFKRLLPRTNFKFFFKSVDPEFGVVKEEITNDLAILPAYKGRVVAWLVSEKVQWNASSRGTQQRAPVQKRIPTNIYEKIQSRERLCSVGSSADSGSIELQKILEPSSPDLSSRLTSQSPETVYSQGGNYENYPTLGRHELLMPSEAASTLGAVEAVRAEQNLILVDLTLTKSTPKLGIHVANSPEGDLLIDNIIEGSLVCLDGRISVGDELLRINDTPLHQMASLDATKVMRKIISTTKEVNLLINKRSQSPFGRFIRPCDPGAWVAHTEAALQEASWENDFAEIPWATAATVELTPPATEHSLRLGDVDEKSLEDAISEIARTMAQPDSGLKIKNRKWLSYHFKNAVLGSEVVDWLQRHGLSERKQAKLLAEKMFKGGLLRNPMIHSFIKKSIYTFSDDIAEHYQKSLDEQI